MPSPTTKRQHPHHPQCPKQTWGCRPTDYLPLSSRGSELAILNISQQHLCRRLETDRLGLAGEARVGVTQRAAVLKECRLPQRHSRPLIRQSRATCQNSHSRQGTSSLSAGSLCGPCWAVGKWIRASCTMACRLNEPQGQAS